jgi:DNA polymerase III delta prime subunit
MNTYIISTKNKEKALGEVEKINKENKVDKFDVELLEFEKAIGIEDVRNIQKKIFLRPFRGERKSLILILNGGATIDAQNSMLKLLEEPPPSSLIFLLTDNYQVFLPTILSRAKIIEIKEEREFDESGFKQIIELDGAGDSLYLAQEVSKDKTLAIDWLESAILSARQTMLENLGDKQKALRLRKMIHRLELTHYDLKTTNVNPRLALENLFLNI